MRDIIKLSALSICTFSLLGAAWWTFKPEQKQTQEVSKRPKLQKTELNSLQNLETPMKEERVLEMVGSNLQQSDLEILKSEMKKIKAMKAERKQQADIAVNDPIIKKVEELESQRREFLLSDLNLSEKELTELYNIRLKYQTKLENLRLEHGLNPPKGAEANLITRQKLEIETLIGANTYLKLIDFEKQFDRKVASLLESNN